MRRTIADPQQGDRHYVVFLPRDFSPGDRRPLIMFLNGQGQNGNDGIRQISNNFGADIWAMRDSFPFVVVAPQCRATSSWSPYGDEAKLAMHVLNEVERDYGTDPDRVYLTGVSSGGTGVWEIASAHPERFAAIVPLCSGEGGDTAKLSQMNLPTWAFYNDADLPRIVNFNRSLRDELIQLGRSPLATEYHRDGHDCWTRAYASAPLYSWMLSHNRRENRQHDAAFSLLNAQTILDEWSAVGAADWSSNIDGTLSCSPTVNNDGAILINPVALQNFEIHLDSQWPRGTRFSLGFFESASAAQPALELSVPYADAGLGGMVSGTGKTVAWLNPVGQRQLDPEGWNDIRVSKRDDVISVTLNGCPALECRHHQLANATYIGLKVHPHPQSTIRWRHIRWRKLDGSVPIQVGDANREGDAPKKPFFKSKRMLDVILSAWQAHESALSNVELEWRHRQDPFTTFGRYPSMPARNGEDTATARMLIEGTNWRFEGWQSCRLKPEGSPDPPLASIERYQFAHGINVLKSLPKYSPLERLRPCRAWGTDGTMTRVWTGTTDRPPRAVIEPIELSSSTPLPSVAMPVEELLLDAVLLSLRPCSLLRANVRLDQLRVIPQSSSTDGERWTILEERFTTSVDSSRNHVRHFLLDSQRGFAIMRVIEWLDNSPRAQIDLRYAIDSEPHALPESWMAMTITPQQDVDAFVRADRKSVRFNPMDTTNPIQAMMPAGTWVVDRVSQ